MKQAILIPALLAAATAGCTTVHTNQVVAAPSAEEAAVKAAVLDYFQGQGQASADRLNKAFAEDVAVMVSPAREGPGFQRREMSEIIPAWASNSNPIGERSDYSFLSVEIVDDRLATVTFRSTDRFYDALTLIKHSGEWQIVAKAYVPQ